MPTTPPSKPPIFVSLKSLFAPPTYVDEDRIWQYRLLNLAMLILLPSASIIGLVLALLADKPTGGFVGAGVSMALAILLAAVSRRGYIEIASRILVYGVSVVFIVFFFFFGGVEAPPFASFVVVIMISGLMLGWKTAAGTAVVGILTGLGLIAVDAYGLLPDTPLPSSPMSAWIVTSLVFIVAAFVLGITTRDVEHALNSARKELRERIQMQGELASLAAVVKQTSETVIITNPAGNIVYVNPQFELDSGYLAAEVAGKNPSFLKSGLHKQEFYADLWGTLLSGDNWRGVITNRRKDGTLYNKESDIFPVRGPEDKVIFFADISRDVTNRLEHEHILEQRLKELTVLHAVAKANAETTSENDLIEQVTLIIGDMLYSDHFGVLLLDEENNGLRPHNSYHGISEESKAKTYPLDDGIAGYVARTGRSRRVSDVTKEPRYRDVTPNMRSELCIPIKTGNQIIGLINAESAERNAFSESDEQLVMTIADQLSTGIEKVRLFEESQRQAREMTAVNALALETTSVLDMDLLLYRLYEEIQELIPAETFLVALYNQTKEEIRIALAMEDNEPVEEMIDLVLPMEAGGLSGHVVTSQEPLLIDDLLNDPLPVQPKHGVRPARSWLGVPLAARGSIIGAISLQSFTPKFFSEGQLQLVESLAAQVAIALDNARLFEAEQDRRRELQAMATISSALRVAENRDEMLPLILQKVEQFSQAKGTSLWMLNSRNQEYICELSSGAWQHWAGMQKQPCDGFSEALETGAPYQVDNAAEQITNTDYELFAGLDAVLHIPLISEDQHLGMVCSGRTRPFEEGEIRVLAAIANIASNAIRRASLHDETGQRLERLHSLRRIDQAINASLDLGLTLRILLEQVTYQLQADAASVALLIPRTQTLETTTRHGFQTEELISSHIRLGSGLAGQAALERITIQVPNFDVGMTDSEHARLMAQEGFNAYFAVPLLAKGRVKGVLEVFHREPFDPDHEWIDFLETLAGQAAIAVENANLVQNLERTNLELTLAYDTTLEGWAHALELRDHETQGHAQRVTELTLQLARDLDLSDEDLVNVRRGTLLHDIGKMGIPDQILLKPGPLTDNEWEIMRQHPVYAHDMLSQIPYLRPALEIPYCHHERWDGTGYPRGLAEEEIPISARIFAVVDVWDALCSDRPYRKAWTKEKALTHIEQEAGAHFDPRIVESFLSLINNDSAHR